VGQLLLVVTGAFAVRGNAVELLPALGSDKLPTSPFEATLRFPNGGERRATATSVMAHVRGTLPPKAMLRLNDVAEDEVPVGTEVWSEGE
jgi:hypothetical protein